jgi:GntR family transcriptional regulator/MocR family aminotransferase
MRKLYGERREATARGLKKALGDHIRIDALPGGMHLILRLPGQPSDSALVERLQQAGIYAEALSDWRIHDPTDSALLLGFANIDSQEMAEQLGRRILQLM